MMTQFLQIVSSVSCDHRSKACTQRASSKEGCTYNALQDAGLDFSPSSSERKPAIRVKPVREKTGKDLVDGQGDWEFSTSSR